MRLHLGVIAPQKAQYFFFTNIIWYDVIREREHQMRGNGFMRFYHGLCMVLIGLNWLLHGAALPSNNAVQVIKTTGNNSRGPWVTYNQGSLFCTQKHDGKRLSYIITKLPDGSFTTVYINNPNMFDALENTYKEQQKTSLPHISSLTTEHIPKKPEHKISTQ